ncbi:hypothetical protein EX30DRAFT_337700 [Ascodesmis nigricans]|uniref:Uncharacterized protein n=1 Tax=Ascodesmis nigricans TaxID=341454 RepID=A0A4S2N7U2_9PEZI|nr:hypothetical protein EX30DRAFT_337700 [Ascodesmis nigricans]
MSSPLLSTTSLLALTPFTTDSITDQILTALRISTTININININSDAHQQSPDSGSVMDIDSNKDQLGELDAQNGYISRNGVLLVSERRGMKLDVCTIM